MLKFLGIEKATNKLLSKLEKIEQLKKVATRNNHAYIVTKLHERLSNEYRFWLAKGPSAKLDDIERDYKYIHKMLEKKEFADTEKSRIVTLSEKYPIT